MSKIEELKAKAYDTLVSIQTLQAQLNNINNEITVEHNKLPITTEDADVE